MEPKRTRKLSRSRPRAHHSDAIMLSRLAIRGSRQSLARSATSHHHTSHLASFSRPKSGLVIKAAARRCSTSASASAASSEEVLWPIAAGATLIGSLCLFGFWLRNDKPILRMLGWVQRVQKSGVTSGDVTLGWLLRVGIAFGVTNLPVESLKVRQLKHGALKVWGAMLSTYDHEQQQIALGALCALLEGDAAREAFHQEATWFDALVQALPPLVHESSAALEQPEILYDALDLSTAVVSHPMFLHAHSSGDAWLWERLLEHSSGGVEYHPEAYLMWACLAAHAAEKHDVALAMLTNPEIKRALVYLTDDEKTFGDAADASSSGESGAAAAEAIKALAAVPPPGGSSSSSSDASWWRTASADDLEIAYARLALHRLAQTSEGCDESELSSEELQERQEPFTRVTYITYRMSCRVGRLHTR